MLATSTTDRALRTILIIDDIPINLGVVVDYMEQRGLLVAIAQDGEEGLRRAEFVQPGLILLDVMLPGLDGFEVCRRLKANERTRDIPVIFMTALTESENKVNGFAAGGVDYVTKPLQMSEVVARVNTHMKLHALQLLASSQNAELLQNRENLERQVAQRTAELEESNRLLQTEIGERKRMEELLRKREQEFRTLSENLPDPIIRYDTKGHRNYLNPAAEKMLGAPASTLVDKKPPDGAVSKSASFYSQKIKQVLDTARAVTFEFSLDWLPEGRAPEYYHVQMVPEFDADGRVAGVLGIGRNITERKNMEDELRQREQQFRTLAENSPDPIYRYDRECRRLYVNPAVGRILGKPIAQLIGSSPADGAILVSDQNKALMAAIRGVFASGATAHVDLDFIDQDGRRRAYDMLIVPERDAGGTVATVLALARDVTERKQLEKLLCNQGQEFRMLSDNSPDVIVRYDRECRRVYINPAYETSIGVSPETCLGKTPLEWWGIPTTPAAVFQGMLQRVLASGEKADMDLDWQRADGRRQCFSMSAVPERDSDGRVVSVLTISRDYTAIKLAQEALHKREQEFRALAENSPDTIARYDRDYRRVYANPRLVAVLGGDMSRILGATAAESPAVPAAAYQKKMQEVFERGEEGAFELRWQSDGVEVCSQIRLTPEFDTSGQVTHVLAVGRDITEIDQYRKKVHRQAFFDSLTGLPNRLLLSDRIAQTIADAAYHGQQFGLMLLDMDHFKDVNDTLGHGVGDRLLCEMAKRMQECVRAYDTVARLGGDEFSVLLPDVRKGDDLATIAGKILHKLAEPFLIDGRELFVTASIGIALYPADSSEIDALYKYADTAMYQAKKAGRNNFQFYAKEFTERSLQRMELEAALRKAQKNGELMLYFQPLIELQSGRVIGAEALLRWNRPGHGVVTPDRFIPIAEESGLIVDIGEWVLRTACATVVDWNRARQSPLRLAVNLSTRQFIRNDLVGALRRILAETGCKPAWLELEITESLLLEDSSEVAAMLAALHEMDLSISIDDFGTGYSALSYLNRFPVSQIKIDRSFVNGIPQQRDKSELVKAMLSIAAALRLEVVAEGVETPEQAEYLLAHGCRLAQGYLFGKPMARAAFESMLASGEGA